jgi:dihydroflavonol-4-reductase
MITAVGKTLVTGASGFIGAHVARALADRGDELKLLVRRTSRIEHLADIDCELARGDITDRRAVNLAMRGVTRVFHTAGITSMRKRDRDKVFAINLDGARNVMESALDAGVERVVHTSSSAAIGPGSRDRPADETQPFTAGGLGIAYMNAKHEAEVEALRLAARGLDIVCVNPTFVLGPDAPSGTSMALVKRFLLRQIPVYTEGALNIVDVRDVADGHLLADRKGKTGERYILGGRNFTLKRLFSDLSRLSGVAPPAIRVPAGPAIAGVRIANMLGLPLPVSTDEARSGTLWWTYRNAKAKKELGFRPRPHEETLEEAVEWQMRALGDRMGSGGPSPLEAPLIVLGRAMRVGGRLVGR